jgi:hypothetical protein
MKKKKKVCFNSTVKVKETESYIKGLENPEDQKETMYDK